MTARGLALRIGLAMAIAGELSACDQLGSKYEIVRAGAQTFLLNKATGESKVIDGSSLIEVKPVEAATSDVGQVRRWGITKLFANKVNVNVATKFRDGRLLYVVTAEPFVGPLSEARLNGFDPSLTLEFIDVDAFDVGEQVILDLRQAKQIVDEKEKPSSLQWIGSSAMSLASYREIGHVSVGWKGFPPGTTQAPIDQK